jgi:hypothetical protein
MKRTGHFFALDLFALSVPCQFQTVDSLESCASAPEKNFAGHEEKNC